ESSYSCLIVSFGPPVLKGWVRGLEQGPVGSIPGWPNLFGTQRVRAVLFGVNHHMFGPQSCELVRTEGQPWILLLRGWPDLLNHQVWVAGISIKGRSHDPTGNSRHLQVKTRQEGPPQGPRQAKGEHASVERTKSLWIASLRVRQ